MSMFLCLINTDGSPLIDDVCRAYGTRPEAHTIVPAHWHVQHDFAALVGSDIRDLVPSVVSVCGWTGVGMAQLHSADQSAYALKGSRKASSDLETLVGCIAQQGPLAVSNLIGDFAFVCWHPARRELVAARDTFGRWRLHFAKSRHLLAFSTRASLLADEESYDLEFIAEYLVNGHGAAGHTAFRGVEAIQPAEVYSLRNSQSRRTRYWTIPSIGWIQESRYCRGDRIVERFREHFSTAVRRALGQRADVWSELSGGMDSSSVVATVSALVSTGAVRHGLGGVVTYANAAGSGGDTQHAALVAQHCAVPQRLLTDWWGWQDDDRGAPLFDQPGRVATYALTRRVTQLVCGAGGRVMLSGLGADLYLRPHLDQAADRVARGDVRGCAEALLQWAVATRTSFWKMAFDHGIYPLMPALARQVLARTAWRVPRWIAPDFARAFELRSRTPATKLYQGRPGDKVRAALSDRFRTEEQYMHREMLGEPNLEWRYPYLDRALVEFALGLPTQWRFGKGESKLLLRESMRDMLPEQVRTRRGKGGLQPDQQLALRREREKLLLLFRHPILCQLGCVLPTKISEAIATAHESKHSSGFARIYHALSLEIWLQSRRASRRCATRDGNQNRLSGEMTPVVTASR
jgi:asparagine synthase (glutamine-hydrolysing)